ncbi:hypothetical protein [Ferrovibrio sp.]|uniref:hypothetical protein n=1 Tax=Ferrovibrio sp. TaxID=1917215 RepID=UPI00311DB1BE
MMAVPGRLAILLLAAAIALPAALQYGAAAEDGLARCRDEAARGLTAACQHALLDRPRDPELHALLGQAYFAGGFYGEGLQSLRRAIAVAGGAAEYRYRFAGYAALINEYTQAAAELEQVVGMQPDHVQAWSLLADCYRYLRDHPRALHATRRAAELGNAAEAYALATRYGSGDGVARDSRLERQWLEQAARLGYVAAMQDLAALYAAGRADLPPDPARQRYWENAARQAAN